MKPVQLLRPDDKHMGLIPQEEGLAYLNSIEGPVLLVAVVGNQRGGKSTLLNLLHSRSTVGFGLGHSYEAQTTGLWIAARKHPRVPDLTVVLMDTEGLDTPGIAQSYNWKLAAVTLLLSSLFVYQTRTSLDMSQLETFQIILQAASHLKKESLQSICDLLWIVRDAQLVSAQPKAELLSKFGAADKERLEKCFGSVDCFPLPRPVANDKDLKNVEGMPYDALTSEFREEYLVLERKIFDQLNAPRQLGGKVITGPVLASLCSMYASAVSASDGLLKDLSDLPTQKQLVARLAGQRALKLAVDAYRAAVAGGALVLPVEMETLYAVHEKAFAEATRVFCEETMTLTGQPFSGDVSPFYEELKAHCMATRTKLNDDDGSITQVVVSGFLHQTMETNDVASQRACRDALAEILSATPPLESVSEFRAKWAAHPRARGPWKRRVENEGTEAVCVRLAEDKAQRDKVALSVLQELVKETRDSLNALRSDSVQQISTLGAQLQALDKTVASHYEEQRDALVDGMATVEEKLEQAAKTAAGLHAELKGALEQQRSGQEALLNAKIADVMARLEAQATEQSQKRDAALEAVRQELGTMGQHNADALAFLEQRSGAQVVEQLAALSASLTARTEGGLSDMGAKLEQVTQLATERVTKTEEALLVVVESRGKSLQEGFSQELARLAESLRQEGAVQNAQVAAKLDALANAHTSQHGELVALVAVKEEELHRESDAWREKLSAILDGERDARVAQSEAQTQGLAASMAALDARLSHSISGHHDEVIALVALKEEEQHRGMDTFNARFTELIHGMSSKLEQLKEECGTALAARVDAQLQETNNLCIALAAKSEEECHQYVEKRAAALEQHQAERLQHMAESLADVRNDIRTSLQKNSSDAVLLQRFGEVSQKLAANDTALSALSRHQDSIAQAQARLEKELKDDMERRSISVAEAVHKCQTHSEAITDSVEAMWAFLGGVNSRLTNCEAVLDERGTITTPNRAARAPPPPTNTPPPKK